MKSYNGRKLTREKKEPYIDAGDCGIKTWGMIDYLRKIHKETVTMRY